MCKTEIAEADPEAYGRGQGVSLCAGRVLSRGPLRRGIRLDRPAVFASPSGHRTLQIVRYRLSRIAAAFRSHCRPYVLSMVMIFCMK